MAAWDPHLVIERLMQESSTNMASAPIAYFYCVRNASEPERADPDEILRSILKQLCSAKSDVPVREPVSSRYKTLKEEADDDGSEEPPRLTVSECVELILGLLDANPATIIIDALDECDPARRHQLLLAFDEIIQNSGNVVKIFVSSRDDRDIACRLEQSPNIYIQASDNEQDIDRFVHTQIDQSIREKRLLGGNVSEELRDTMIVALIKGAQGM
ncbi:hypothetical protein DH86_00003943 [Scytalidium sp. 3C]|nr:hypothetical protein DH86_00003943 [Scytalidium sp. 3C]